MKYAVFSFRLKIFPIKIVQEKTNNKKELIESFVKRERRKDGELQNLTSLSDAVTRVKEYERLIKSEKQNVISLAYQQGFITQV